jgi:hypothetical protein
MNTLRDRRPPFSYLMHGTESGRRVVLFLLTLVLPACGGGGDPGPSPSPSTEPLGPTPVLLSPVNNAQATSDTPTFTVRNAQGFDQGQANYTFRLTTASGQREIATSAVPAGSGRTSLTFASALPRGMSLSWSVVARSAASEVASSTASFRTTAVVCGAATSPYAKSVVEWFVPACNLAQNIYNDPQDVLGPPDGGGVGPNNFFGFLSLGDEGHVTVDMETCAVDLPGPDVRVYQFVAQEPVTLYAGGSPTGPFQLLAYRTLCGTRVPGGGAQRRYCDFDLGAAEVQEARYFKVEDGELFPCPGGTPSEGADIDAVEILHLK